MDQYYSARNFLSEHPDIGVFMDTNQYVDEDAAFAASESQSGSNRSIKIGIFDRSSPDGKYPSKEKKNALLRALFEMMYRELLSDENIMPRFSWSGIVDNAFRAVAVGEASAEFLKDRVEKMPPPWDRARLEVVYKSTKPTKVEAYVPGELISTNQLLAVINEFDPMFQTIKWQKLALRPHNQGHVFTFAIDVHSYNLLEKYNGFIPYWNSGIEFRVLKC